MLLRILSNPAANVFQKQLTAKGIHPLAVNFYTYLLLSVACIVVAVKINWAALPQPFWMYSALVGLFGALGNGLLVKALQKGDLSVLGPINAYKPVVSIIFAIFLLQELPGLPGLVGVALIIAGSYFVLDTAEEKFSFRLLLNGAIQLRIGAMVLTAIEAVFIKVVIQYSDSITAFINWCWFGALFSLPLLFTYKHNSAPKHFNLNLTNLSKLALVVVCIGAMQFTTNYTLAHMDVGYALALFQLSAIVSVLLGYRIFREQDLRKKLVGAAIMVVGSAVILLFKNN